jgi:hypothetical protein
MPVNGRDCSIVVKTQYRETGLPYTEEMIREAVSFLTEEAAIEGDGSCRGIRKSAGVTGCVVTPLTIGTAPLLFHLAMIIAGLPLFVSETRNLYLYQLNLLPMEDSTRFDLVQKRGGSRKLYESCAVTAFELRINRKEAVKLKLDISGEQPPVIYPYTIRISVAVLSMVLSCNFSIAPALKHIMKPFYLPPLHIISDILICFFRTIYRIAGSQKPFHRGLPPRRLFFFHVDTMH